MIDVSGRDGTARTACHERSRYRNVGTLVAGLVCFLAAAPASAHLMPAQNGTINVVDASAYVVLGVPVSALSGVDDNRDGGLDPAELSRHDQAIKAQIAPRFTLTADVHATSVGPITLLSPLLRDDTALSTPYLLALREVGFAAPPRSLRLSTDLFGTSPDERQITLRATYGDGVEMAVLTPHKTEHQFFQNAWGTLVDFTTIGALHILFGFDHLLFLLTILVIGVSWRQLALTATAFTIAHSLTLAAAGAGWVTVPADVIEPLIAASIVGIALDNLFGAWRTRSHQIRLAIVFACGLLHGLGFASAIAGFGLESRHWLASLAGFNLGIELGQALFLAALVAAGWLARRTVPILTNAGTMQVTSTVTVVLGCGMLWSRLVG